VASNGGTHAVHSKATDGRALRTGVFASLCFALVALSAAIVIPMILAWVEKTHLGEGMEKQTSNYAVLARLWMGSQALCGILMLASVVVTSQPQGVLLIALLGVPWAVTQWVPLAIIGCEVADARHEEMRVGTVLGIHNVAISAPQILAGLMATIVYVAADAAGSRVPTAWVLAFGGCAAVYASRLAVGLI
jgi:solute carrier family 45 protein 1/2/4